MRGFRPILLILGLAPFLTGCLWLNTLFNERKAWEMAEASRAKRFRKNPLDTVQVSPEEKALYERTIAKGSKVLELWPKDSSWHPEALILIGKAQQRLSQFDRALKTYFEIYEKHPESPRFMGAVQGEVECLLALGRHVEAADWMKRLDSLKIEGGPAGLAWLRAQLALGRLDTNTARRELKRILSIKDAPEDRKAQSAWLLGNLAWAQADWQEARTAYLRPEILHLPYVQRFQSRLTAAQCLDKLGSSQLAVDEMRTLPSKGFQRSESEVVVEMGRIELRQGWFSEGIKDLVKLEKMLEPPDRVAEGLVLLGDDARNRRIDDREALRVYLVGARAGGQTFWGIRAKELADALSDLAKLRESKIADSSRFDWNFSLAEIYLLRLSNRDSASAAYRRIQTDTSASRARRARATYALAWISDAMDTGPAKPQVSPWLSVVSDYPGTEFAKTAQRLAGVPVTTVTLADSAENAFRQAEILWMDRSDPRGAIKAYEAISPWNATEAGRRSRYAIGWIWDNVSHDTTKARTAYKFVVDSLPGTAWARKADGIIKGIPQDFLAGSTRANRADVDFEEGEERVDTTRSKFGPRKPPPPSLDDPEPIPPRPEDQFLSPEDFQ